MYCFDCHFLSFNQDECKTFCAHLGYLTKTDIHKTSFEIELNVPNVGHEIIVSKASLFVKKKITFVDVESNLEVWFVTQDKMLFY